MTHPTTVITTIEWSPAESVELGLGDVVIFPKQQALPGLYRITIGEASGSTWVFIGESVNLQRRMQHHTRPGTSHLGLARITARIHDVLREEGVAAVAIATAVTVEVDGQAATVDLIRQTDRSLAEAAALVAARFEGADQILNIDGSEI